MIIEDYEIENWVLETLRKRRGLKPDDSSKDEIIKEFSRRDAVEEICGWELGSGNWFQTFEDWLNSCGLKIVKKNK